MTVDLKEDVVVLGYAVGSALTSVAALVSLRAWLAWTAVGAVDVYLLVVLFLACLWSDDKGFHGRHPWVRDFGPTPGYGQRVVIAELSSAIVLLMSALPLLVSRMSTFVPVSGNTNLPIEAGIDAAQAGSTQPPDRSADQN